MEVFLNLAWTLLAIASFSLWVRRERRNGTERYLPLIALVMLLVILFPVISVTDDFWSIQNPAEADACVRRDQIAPLPQSILPSWAAVPPPFAESTEAQSRPYHEVPRFPATRYSAPALHAIENRPPPVA